MGNIVKILLPVYGLFLIVGGAIGYVKAESLASLFAGGIAGILALVSFAIALKRPRRGFIMGLVVAVLVGARFAIVYQSAATPNYLALGIASGSCILGVLLILAIRSPQKSLDKVTA